jgi:predicted TIM-barrel fold metal-dependent hydrolase
MKQGRRDFLKLSLASAAACSLARPLAANPKPASASITDTHIYLGHWPHHTLASEDPAKLVANLRNSGVTQAWTGTFDGLFHKDVAAVNQRLAAACAKVGDDMLIPFGTVNPTLPDWEDDIRRCHESFHLPGIRLHPNYHGYKLDDSRFARTLELASARGLIVQLVAWMEDERHFLLSPQTTSVDLKPLADKAAAFPNLKILVSGGDWTSDVEAMRRLTTQKQIYFDCTRTKSSSDIRRLVDMATTDRVVFGSGAPLRDLELSVSRLQEAKLSDSDWKSVASKNAGRLLIKSTKS